MSLLAVHDLRVSYLDRGQPLPALRGVDLTVEAGQTVGVAGESGCGKSTLAMAILRLLPANARVSGQILLDGEDVLAMNFGRLRAVRWSGASIVFQGAMHALNPVQSIGTQIAEPILLHSPGTSRAAARQRVAQLLEQVGVPAWRAQSFPHELSGGQKQRVMIAMALACSPRLIIADEPTTALDVMVQAQVMALLQQLVREHGVGMILISHDLSVLSAQCDQVAVMYAGRIAELGPGPALFSDAVHPYAKALADAFPVIGDASSRRAPKGLPGDPPDPRDLGGGCAFQPRCQVALDECAHTEVELRSAGPGRSAACLHVPGQTRGGHR